MGLCQTVVVHGLGGNTTTTCYVLKKDCPAASWLLLSRRPLALHEERYQVTEGNGDMAAQSVLLPWREEAEAGLFLRQLRRWAC